MDELHETARDIARSVGYADRPDAEVARDVAEIPMAVERLTNQVDRNRALFGQLEDALGMILRVSEVGADKAVSDGGGYRTTLGQALYLQTEQLAETNLRLQDVLDRVRLAL